MKNKFKLIGAVLTLGLGVCFAAIAVKIQTDPMAFTHKHPVVDVSAPARVIKSEAVALESRAITLDPVTVVGELHRDVGAAYTKPKPPTKPCEYFYQIVGFKDAAMKKVRGVWTCL